MFDQVHLHGHGAVYHTVLNLCPELLRQPIAVHPSFGVCLTCTGDDDIVLELVGALRYRPYSWFAGDQLGASAHPDDLDYERLLLSLCHFAVELIGDEHIAKPVSEQVFVLPVPVAFEPEIADLCPREDAIRL